ENFARPFHAFVFEFRDGHDGVDEAHFQRLLRVVLAAQIPDLARLLLADDARQITGTKAAVEAAHFGPNLAEDSVVRRDGEIAHKMKHVATADGIARHKRDHDLRHRANEFLQIEHIETRHAV